MGIWTPKLPSIIFIMVEQNINGALHVVVTGGSDDFEFSTNLIGYVRFMIQHNDLTEKVSFLALYIMLIVFSVKFTWTYLKRVVNMAFLTIIAPTGVFPLFFAIFA